MNPWKFHFLVLFSILLSPLGRAEKSDSWPYLDESGHPRKEMNREPRKDGEPSNMDADKGGKKPLSPEEKKRRMMEFREKFKNMTPEEREEALRRHPLAKNLSPERREALKQRLLQPPPAEGGHAQGDPSSGKIPSGESQARREEFRKKMENLSPEDREAFRKKMEQRRAESGNGESRDGEKTPRAPRPHPPHPDEKTSPGDPASGTPQNRREEFRKKMENLSPEDREAFHKKMEARRGESGREKDGEKSPRPRTDSPETQALREEMRKKMESLSPEDRKKLQEFRQKMRDMSPEERQKAMQDLPFFKDLTEDQKELMRKRAEHFKNMPPEQKEKMMENFKKWKEMSPEDRENARKIFRSQQRPGPGGEPRVPPRD